MNDQENVSNTKLLYLNSLEKHVPCYSEVDYSKKKYFTCFPYAYMNGKLHLGHVFSFSKADFTAYFKKLQGYNVLLPFGFHCTGMPISASASKLKEELEGKPVDLSVVKILKSNGIEDVKPFTDPKHWIRIFPKLGIDTMSKYNPCIDWRRSFITTEQCKYYDSFIRFQFNKLKKLNLLNFGKRYSIYCTIDQQACLDHDRRKGEGIKSIEVILRKVDTEKGILLVRAVNFNQIEKVVVYRNVKLIRFENNKKVFVIEEELYENLKYQVDDSRHIDQISGLDLASKEIKIEFTDNMIPLKITGKKVETGLAEFQEISARQNEQKILVESSNFVKIYEPEGPVISRSGSKCVVSLLDQWYIDYSNSDWKVKVRECAKSMQFTDETRAKFEESIEWIGKWGFSRSFGLGTRIPWDEQYFIDSLSDSTIYMAFYTFKHLLFNDLEGKEEIFPSHLLCDEVWQYIFMDTMIDMNKNFVLPEKLVKYKDILDNCKKSLEYFYPVDMRVSAKDLIGNHLTFFIFNHVALFKQEFWPKRIFTNGYIMLNSAKMSKSEGNFLSIEDGIKKFGTSAMRMCLALCGDTNEDANFVEANANALVLKLFTLVKTIEALSDYCPSDSLNNLSINDKADKKTLFVDKAFIQIISRNIKLAVDAYENIVFRDVIKYGFYENLHLIELYGLLGGSNQALISYGYKTICQILYPIIPSLALHLIEIKFNGDLSLPSPITSETEMVDAVEHVRDICSKINTSKKKSSDVTINVGSKFADWKVEAMKLIDSCQNRERIIEACDPIFVKHGINKKKGLVFCMDYFKNRDNYAIRFDEFEVINVFKEYIENTCSVKANVVIGENAEPKAPILEFK